jgi:hypothetical protein
VEQREEELRAKRHEEAVAQLGRAGAAQVEVQAREKSELLGETPDGANFGERAMRWLAGEGEEESKDRAVRRKGQRMEAELDEVRNRLNERGERLGHLADRTAELADASEQFAQMAKQLREQQRGPFGLW